ncbi:MAG: hypothetical protein ABR591_03645 [Candidatus Velthaea sp.]
MNGDSAAAQHLAELDAQHAAYLRALRDRAGAAHAAAEAGASALESAAAAGPSRTQPLIADTPLVVPEGAADFSPARDRS